MTFATHGLVANLSRRSRLWFALCPLLCELGRGWGPAAARSKTTATATEWAAKVGGDNNRSSMCYRAIAAPLPRNEPTVSHKMTLSGGLQLQPTLRS